MAAQFRLLSARSTSTAAALPSSSRCAIVRSAFAARSLSYAAPAKKRFGQHFLNCGASVARIVELAGICADSARVVEIGPGRGVLTRALLETGADVRAVEVDRDLAAELRADLPALGLIEGDALDVDWEALAPRAQAPWTVCANLPYNVATPLVTRMVTMRPRLDRLVLMFQREVAERLVAQPNSKAYGSLSIHIQTWCDARIAFHLPPSAFSPPPKVESSVVVLDLREEPRHGACTPHFFEKAVRAGFHQRRKVLPNALAVAFPKPLVRDVLKSAGHERKRAQELSVEQWAALAAKLEVAMIAAAAADADAMVSADAGARAATGGE